MERGIQGTYEVQTFGSEAVRSFVPFDLPPTPPVDMSGSLRRKHDDALVALGRLDAASIMLPDTNLLLYLYIRKEAVLSSMIEGTQSSLSDLLVYEIGEGVPVPLDDVRDVSNYVAAINYGMRQINAGVPLSNRLLRETHAVLLSGTRGENQQPGEYRRSQNWIGGTRPGNAAFVPPPADAVVQSIGTLELFLSRDNNLSPLTKIALAHVQFETIHPFLDGNGRLGRLLITLFLCEQGILREPTLYLSLFLKSNRSRYYSLLGDVRARGDWEAWLEFFFEGIASTADSAVATARKLSDQAALDRSKVIGLGRAASSALRVHHEMVRHPVATSPSLVKATGLTPVTVNKALDNLGRLGIIDEVTGQQRNRLYVYSGYLGIASSEIDQLVGPDG